MKQNRLTLIDSDSFLPLSKLWFSLLANLILSWLFLLGGTGGDDTGLLASSSGLTSLDPLLDAFSSMIGSTTGMPRGKPSGKPIGGSIGNRRMGEEVFPRGLRGAVGGGLYGGGVRKGDVGVPRSGVDIGEVGNPE